MVGFGLESDSEFKGRVLAARPGGWERRVPEIESAPTFKSDLERNRFWGGIHEFRCRSRGSGTGRERAPTCPVGGRYCLCAEKILAHDCERSIAIE